MFKKHVFFLSKNESKPENFEALKLNLHPQEYMFKIGDGKGIPYNFTALTGATNNGRSSKYFQGSFTNGYTNYFDGISETGGIFFKDTNGVKIYKSILHEQKKIKLNQRVMQLSYRPVTVEAKKKINSEIKGAECILNKPFFDRMAVEDGIDDINFDILFENMNKLVLENCKDRS